MVFVISIVCCQKFPESQPAVELVALGGCDNSVFGWAHRFWDLFNESDSKRQTGLCKMQSAIRVGQHYDKGHHTYGLILIQFKLYTGKQFL